MAFEPDIIVQDREMPEFILVAEAKMDIDDLGTIEPELKRYMAGMRCPVGLLVTPQRLLIYRDRYLGPPEKSVERVGDFEVAGVFRFKPSGSPGADAVAFQTLVQSWLEGLAEEAGLRALPQELRRAIQQYILPSISDGTIRAAHPRVA